MRITDDQRKLVEHVLDELWITAPQPTRERLSAAFTQAVCLLREPIEGHRRLRSDTGTTRGPEMPSDVAELEHREAQDLPSL